MAFTKNEKRKLRKMERESEAIGKRMVKLGHEVHSELKRQMKKS